MDCRWATVRDTRVPSVLTEVYTRRTYVFGTSDPDMEASQSLEGRHGPRLDTSAAVS